MGNSRACLGVDRYAPGKKENLRLVRKEKEEHRGVLLRGYGVGGLNLGSPDGGTGLR